VARDADVPLLRPERVGDPEVVRALAAHGADLGVVVAYGQFLPRSIRELPALGYLVNAHASLLPRHRGAAPIAHAILAGDRTTGISIMRVEREMDAGPVALQRTLEIGPDENAGELAERLSLVAADAIAEALDRIADGTVTWTPQDDSRATLAPKLDRETARLDWRRSAASLVLHVRAMAPSPGAWTRLGDDTLRVLAARAEAGAAAAPPGTVQTRGVDGLRIATGEGWLVPLRLQRAGGKALDVDTYLRGRPIEDGAKLD
jgi:methionyl-tRNA formyltransferase